MNNSSGLLAKNSFQKSDRLFHKKSIDDVFQSGNSFKETGLKTAYRFVDNNANCGIKLMVTVPRKIHRTAVARNKIKRRIREAYRIHNHQLKSKLSDANKSLEVVVIYLSREIMDYREIESKIILTLQRLINLTDKPDNL